MNKILLKLLVAGGLSLLLVSSLWGGVVLTNTWTNFYGHAWIVDGEGDLIPVPVGTIIDAYTLSGLNIGSDTVRDVGNYGFMPVYGDDFTTSTTDGAQPGSIIYFEINGGKASPSGPNPIIWSLNAMRQVDLAVISLSPKISMAEDSFTKSKQVKRGETFHFGIAIKNTGDGTDFYALTCTSFLGWQIVSDTGAYCEAGKKVVLGVDLIVPNDADMKETERINYTVHSGTDPNLLPITGILRAFFSTTDTPEDRSVLPGGFKLHQNYPNPYNPTTMISYDLSVASDVSLEVFDLLGRKINHFDFGRQTAGNHSFEYSAGQLPSGIYFYRIQAGDFSDMKKMVLMK